MPRIAATPATYLDQLTAARRRAKAGTIVNAKELADATGITWRILEQWIVKDKKLPVLQRGDLGTPYRFDLRKTIDYLIARGREIQKQREARGKRTAKLAGFGDGASTAKGTSPAASDVVDRANEARALKALGEAQMTVHRLKREQGQYVRADIASAVLMEVMTTVQTEVLAASATLDPAGLWPVNLREDIDGQLRNMLIAVRDKVDAALLKWKPDGRA